MPLTVLEIPRLRLLAGVACGALVAGCTVGPNFEPPAAPTATAYNAAAPSGEKLSVPVAEPVDPKWWNLFADPQLTKLEMRLDAGNLDLKIAALRLAESRAQFGVVSSAQYPEIDGNAGFTTQQQSREGVLVLTQPGTPSSGTAANGAGTGLPNSALTQRYDLYQYGFDATWEVDFWGRIRRLVESAGAQITASEETLHDTQVTASAELARDYVQLRGTQRNLAITRENLKSSQDSLRLTRDRAAGGLTTDLDVANAAAQVENISAQLPSLEQRQAMLINAISLLLGEQPRALEVELAAPRAVPPVPPRVPVGVPSELARRRPDIRHAEAVLHGATADIGVAVADYYPRFTLAGSGAMQGLQYQNLFDWPAHTYSLGPSVTLPIFTGWRVTANVELKKESQKEAAVNYQRTVLGALHDVDNALTDYDAEQRRRLRLEQAAVQTRRALELARARYEQGVTDFLQVLIAQRDQLAAEQQLSDSTTTVSTNLVQLYKALGGGWDITAAPAPAAASL
jgi:NodT family efflux transporter outer membrane factor (OMF) lipoprotein